jgi:hypothetical protein
MMGRLEGVRLIGRPRKRWMDGVQTDAKELLKVKNWKTRALDRDEWRHIIGKAKARFGLQRNMRERVTYFSNPLCLGQAEI